MKYHKALVIYPPLSSIIPITQLKYHQSYHSNIINLNTNLKLQNIPLTKRSDMCTALVVGSNDVAASYYVGVLSGGSKLLCRRVERGLILPATRTWRNRFVALSVPSTQLRFLLNHPQNLLLDLQT